MPAVRVLPANSVSAIVDNQDKHDLPLQRVSLMMRGSRCNFPDLSTAVDIQD